MSLEPRKCLHCPHHPSSPTNPRDIYVGHHYSLFISPDCTHSSIQQLDDHYPQPPASEDTTTTTIQAPKKSHTYAHCSRCNLIIDYDVWGCGCDGFQRSEAGIVAGSMMWRGFCTHQDAVITVRSEDRNQRLRVSRRGVLSVWRLRVMRCVWYETLWGI